MIVNVIGDIHGRKESLVELLKIMPKAERTIAVGDLIDKGINSIDTVDKFIKTKNFESVLGNHEALFIASHKVKHPHIKKLSLMRKSALREQYMNSSSNLRSDIEKLDVKEEEKKKQIKRFSDYFAKMKLEIIIDNIYISHTPNNKEVGKLIDHNDEFSKLFSMSAPKKKNEYFCIFGHTEKPRIWSYNKSSFKMVSNIIEKGEGIFSKEMAIGIDGSPGLLMGISIDSKTLKYTMYAVDGSNEWSGDLGKKYRKSPKKSKSIQERIDNINRR